MFYVVFISDNVVILSEFLPKLIQSQTVALAGFHLLIGSPCRSTCNYFLF